MTALAPPPWTVTQQALLQQVQQSIKNTIHLMLTGLTGIGNMSDPDREATMTAVRYAVQSTLQGMVDMDQIRGYAGISVELDGHKPFYEVDSLKPGTCPGDPYIVINDKGEEQYEGIVLACNDSGWGLILSEEVEGTGLAKVKCHIQLAYPIKYVTIMVEQEQ